MADLNGDGKLDLAVANYGEQLLGDGTISIFLGDGGGTFSSATLYSTQTNLPGAQSVAIGDLTGDHIPDLAVASASNLISILVGNGDGTFVTQSPLSFSGLNNNGSIAMADLNGDGRLDLALTNFGAATGDTVNPAVTVLFGQVGGGFNRIGLGTGINPSSVAIGDLNGDGHLDLAVTYAGSNTVSVLLGDGTGSFSAATPYATGANPQSVAIGDLNGDGRLDLAVANRDSNTVSVLLGNVGGGFQQQTQYPTGVDPSSVAIGDLNGDGRLDLAVANLSTNNVTVLLNTPTAVPFAFPTFQLSAFGPNAGGWSSNDTYPRAVADVNGGGMADIVGFSSAGVFESLATGGGAFAAPTFELAAFGVDAGGWSSNDTYPRTLADVNADGMADIIGFSSAGVFESLATGGGHFAAPTFELAAFGTNAGGWSSDNTYPRALADVNGDTRADIVAFSSAGVFESLATGNGDFMAPTFELAAFGTNAGGWSSDNTYPRALADVNGDHMADIVGFGADGVFVSLATGGGHFAAPTFELAAFGASTGAGGWTSQDLYPRTLADVNGDGMADIVGFGAGGIAVSLATGGGHFASPTFQLSAFGLDAGWSSDTTYPRQLADINGNGTGDIVGFAVNGVMTSPH
jgi:FG-GAP-like repeat